VTARLEQLTLLRGRGGSGQQSISVKYVFPWMLDLSIQISKQQHLTTLWMRSIVSAAFAFWLLGFCNAATAQDQKPRIATTSERFRQINGQVSRLVSAINDEYGAEVLAARRVRLIDVPDYGTMALAVFTIESFAMGNNFHQFLAIFGPPDEPNEKSVWPYYSLTGLAEVGDGCDVHVENAEVKYVGKRTLKIAMPNSITRFCSGQEISFLLKPVENSRLNQLCRTDASGRCM
jgi:hypothetical protein